jgi:steroid delta-isomerase-like uncharacterized protein
MGGAAMPNRDAQDVVKVIFDGFNSRDLDRVAAICSDDFVLEDIPAGMQLHGPDGLRGWLANWITAAPDSHADLRLIFGEGEHVATEHFGTATHTGPLQTPIRELPATGKRLAIWFSENYIVRDGKLTSIRVFYDGATVMRQLGLIPG